MKFLLLVALFVLIFAKKTLVIVDNSEIENTHSQFFQSLRSRGHDLTFQVRGKKIQLQNFGEYIYENLIIMSPKADGELSPRLITDFVDSQHNVLIVANGALSHHLREVAQASGIEFDDDGNRVFDFFNKNEGGVVSTTNCHAKVATCKSPVLYKGLAMSLDENSELLIPMLTGSKTAYSYGNSPLSDKPFVMGRKTVLVAGVQARNSARITFAGSMEMFSNKFLSDKKNGNELFVSGMTKWSFGEKGILRHRKVFHNRVGEEYMPGLYTVSDEIEYQVVVEEFVDSKWVPYIADDIQLELTMLDPYIRITLQHVTGGRYYTKFRVPDVYGVFKFVVNYKQPGFSHLVYSDEIVIRPLRINQFERFIPTAYPYYAALFSVMAGFFAFGVAFLYSKEKEE